MPLGTSCPSLSTKRAILCSRENAVRIAERIFTDYARAFIVRTNDPLQPYRAVAQAQCHDDVEVALRV